MKLPFKSFLLIIFLSSLCFSQNIKVTYAYMPSEDFEYEENVYLNNNFKVSVIDSIPKKKFQPKDEGADVIVQRDKDMKPYRKVLIDDLKKNDIYFTFQIKKVNYMVSDNPPLIKWNLKYNEVKKIGKYKCRKATATFRGTDLEAWYTPDIPVSIGPYKFKGLPGLILEIKTLGLNNKYWIVKNIQFPYEGIPNYSPKYIKSLKQINLRDLVKKIDDRNAEEESMFQSKIQLPPGVRPPKIETVAGNMRGMIEQKFEWE